MPACVGHAVGSALRAKDMAPDLCAQHRRQRSLLQRRQAVPRCTVRDAKYEATAAAHTVRPWPRASQQCTRPFIHRPTQLAHILCLAARKRTAPPHPTHLRLLYSSSGAAGCISDAYGYRCGLARALDPRFALRTFSAAHRHATLYKVPTRMTLAWAVISRGGPMRRLNECAHR